MYKRNGQQVLFIENGVSTHICDARDSEAAHLIVDRLNGHSSKFIPEALATRSPLFHGDMVSDGEFRSVVNEAIDALTALDKVKKSLFYGRDNNLISEGEVDVSSLPENFGGNDNAIVRSIAIDIIHAILGVATEAGELLEALREAYNGNGFDWVNIKEELGDIHWYEAILANHGDFTFEETMQLIIAKLRKRFPEKFTAFDANNRNLDAERAILESGSMRDEGDMIAGAPIEMVSYPATEIDRALELCEQGTQAHGDEFYGPIRDIIDPNASMAPTSIGGDSLHSPPLLVPTSPASGPAAVNEAEARSNAAFDAVESVGSDSVDAPGTTGTGNSELAKSPAARSRRFPDEHLSNQPVRREDLE
jgi:NTP pyrophosphatase (non-canonical NTP hydrolase)